MDERKKAPPGLAAAEGRQKERGGEFDEEKIPPSDSKVKLQVGESFRPYRQFRGFIVPNCLARSGLLSHPQLLIYGRLSQYAGKDGECFCSYQTLADELHLSRKSTVNNVKALIKIGLLKREIRPGRTSKFHFLWHEVFENPGKEVPQVKNNPGKEVPQVGGEDTSPGGGEGSSPGVGKQVLHEESPLNESLNLNHTEETASPVCDVSDSFSEEGKAKESSEGEQGDKNQLSDLYREYIRLASQGKDNPAAYRATLTKAAKRGELEVTEEEVAKLRENSIEAWINEPSEVQHGVNMDGEPITVKVDKRDQADQKAVRENFEGGMEYGNSLQYLCDAVFLENCSWGLELPVDRIKKALLVVYPDEAKLSSKKVECVAQVRRHSRGGPFGEKLLPSALNRLKELDPELAEQVEMEEWMKDGGP